MELPPSSLLQAAEVTGMAQDKASEASAQAKASTERAGQQTGSAWDQAKGKAQVSSGLRVCPVGSINSRSGVLAHMNPPLHPSSCAGAGPPRRRDCR